MSRIAAPHLHIAMARGLSPRSCVPLAVLAFAGLHLRGAVGTPPPPPPGWRLAQADQSCAAACPLPSAPCHAASMRLVNQPHLFERVKLQLGVEAFACGFDAAHNVSTSDSAPSVDPSLEKCILPSATANCASTPGFRSGLRFCCCSSTGCATDLPDRVKAWPQYKQLLSYIPLDG